MFALFWVCLLFSFGQGIHIEIIVLKAIGPFFCFSSHVIFGISMDRQLHASNSEAKNLQNSVKYRVKFIDASPKDLHLITGFLCSEPKKIKLHATHIAGRMKFSLL